MARVQHLTLQPGRRVIAVSDIHGNLPYLRGLLEKICFSREDTLLVLGDFVEKGEYSLETLRFLMELCRTHDVHILRGNCDGWHLGGIMDPNNLEEAVRRYLRAQKPGRGPGLLVQMCREAGIPEDGEDVPGMMRSLEEKFAAELDFIRGLPHIIETERFTFVHGGLPDDGPMEDMEPFRCMKNDAFMCQGRRFDKWVIVGHWPVMLYARDICQADPIVDSAQRIVSIDGGCVLKLDGQLNALFLPAEGSDEFRWTSYDAFPVRRVRDAQEASSRSFYICWGDSEVEVLERGPELSRCRHCRTGYEMDILTKYLYERRGVTHCEDSTDYVLPLSPGDEVSVVEETSRGFLVKHKGVSGWYFGEFMQE